MDFKGNLFDILPPELAQQLRNGQSVQWNGMGIAPQGQMDSDMWTTTGYQMNPWDPEKGDAWYQFGTDGAFDREGTMTMNGRDNFGKMLALWAGTALTMGTALPGVAGGAAGGGAGAAGAVAGDAFLPGALGAGGSEVAFGSVIPGLEAYALPAGAAAAGGAAGASAGSGGAAGGAFVGPPTSAPALTGFEQYLAPSAGAAGGATNALTRLLPTSAGGWASLAGPLASLAGGAISANAAGEASDAQLQAAREAMALQEPFRQGGMTAMNRLMDLLGLSKNTGAEGYGSAARDFGMSDFEKDPGYQFRMDEGTKAIERSAAARGGLFSGATGKALTRYGQDVASQEFGNAFNRFQTNRANKLNPLQSLMGAGQTAANTIGNYGTQAGDARAAGTVGSANAWNQALGQGVSSYQNGELMNRLLNGRSF